MTPYLIFVIVLTIAYIIYYGYNISKDIYGKKGETKSTEEVFDMQSLSEEVIATPVKEMDGGFSLGEDIVDTPVANDDEHKAAYSKFKELPSQLEEADVQSEGGMFENDMIDFMVEQRSNDSSSDAYRKSKIDEERQTF
jgi:hypothetical protein